MVLEEIEELFEKLELYPTLDSISIILKYTDEQLVTTAFNLVVRKKYEKFTDEFEGINEYDYICQILNFDISEFKRNIHLFSEKELIFIQSIINNALNGIDKKEFANRIIPILEEYKEIGTNKFVEEIKIENFFNKFDTNELYALNIVLNNNCESYIKRYKDIFNKVLTEKEEVRYKEYSLSNLLNKIYNLNNEEINLLYELVENASLYLSSIQEYSDIYENIIEDFDINEYPIMDVYKLEEKLSKKIENIKNKQLIYKNNNIQ